MLGRGPRDFQPRPHDMAQRDARPSLSLVAYGEDEEDEGTRSSDDDMLVPRKRARVQKAEEGGSPTLIDAHHPTCPPAVGTPPIINFPGEIRTPAE